MEVLISSTTNPSETERFECNICLESDPNEPVVTLCGHLYCWPCIYQWLRQPQTSSLSSPSDHDHDHDHDHEALLLGQKKSCPVCKAEISGALVVPLYGRASESASRAHTRGFVPRRPPPPKLDISACNALVLKEIDRTFLRDRRPETAPYYSYLGATTAGMFGNADSVFLFPSYPEAGYRSPRMRRREVRMERSLNRVSFFLFCCFIMFLVLFWYLVTFVIILRQTTSIFLQ